MSELNRILVIGPVGAGKSYAADGIAEVVDKPLIRIDSIMLDENRKPKPKDQFIEDARAHFALPEYSDGWVADGSYRSIRAITWEQADVIAYLRPGIARNIGQVVWRGLRNDTSGGNSGEPTMDQVRRVLNTRGEDIAKYDGTVEEFGAAGTEILTARTANELIVQVGELALKNI